MFVLDSSGSIGADNYETVKGFVIDFTKELTIGPKDIQVGVVTYSNSAETVFDLDDHRSNSELQNAISNITYTGGGTNTPAGLQEMLTLFDSTVAKGARNDTTVLRFAVVITDGQSGVDVESTTAEVKAVIPGILVFALGIANADNEELRLIATGPQYINHIDNFAESALDDVLAQQTFLACFTGKYIELSYLQCMYMFNFW